MRHVLALAMVVACGGGSATRPVPPAKPADDVDPRGAHAAEVAAQVQPLIDAELASSIVVGLYTPGGLEIYGFGAGPGGAPPTGRTLYELGSVTKVYTSLLLADAVQRREVALEQPVAELLPPGVTVPTRDGKPITLGHLAIHTSGLPRMPPSLVPRATAADPYAGYGENELYADLVRTQLESPPGVRMSYSNYGAGLLGFALGRKLGGYRAAVTTRILQPLGLRDTTFTVASADAARRAPGTNTELVRVPPWTWEALAGAGALISSARDQLALIEAELDAASGGKRALRRAMALTQESQLSSTGPSVGLGWQIDVEGRYWHNGTTGGHHAFVGFDPKTRRGIVLLAGTSTQIVDQVAKKLYAVLAGEDVKPPVMPTPEQLASYAGSYNFSGQKLTMIAQGKRLYVEGPGEPKIRMLPISDTEFWIEPLSAIAVFQPVDGKVVRVVFVVGEQQVAAPRITP